MNQTFQHSLVFSHDDDQAKTCGRPTPLMTMMTGICDHPRTCDDDEHERKRAKDGRPSPLETRMDPEPPVESTCLLELDSPEELERDRSPSLRPLSCLEVWCLGESWHLSDLCDLLLRSPLRDLWYSDPSELGRPATDADFSTSVAFDPELVAVLACLDLDDPSLLARLKGS